MTTTHLLHTKVKTAKGRKISSTRWLQRQLNDPYVAKAKAEGWRARSAFKIIELNDKFHFFKKGGKVVDLGCSPGGWCQVAVQKVSSDKENPTVFGIDLLPTNPIDGAVMIQLDFMDEKAPDILKEMTKGKVDVVMSDMAANTTGIQSVDHLRIMNLVESAYDFARQILKPNGVFIAKIFQGGHQTDLLTLLKKEFKIVKHVKPKSSRSDSVEYYIVCLDFKGLNQSA